MLKKWHRTLIISNLSVFLVVLSVFCIAVYVFAASAFENQLKDKLSVIADSAISSIDFDHDGHGQPDLIFSVLPDDASPSLQTMRLQWCAPDGKLELELGTMALELPFDRQSGFQSQESPPALVLTRPAIADGKLLGYVRVGHPLADVRKQESLLFKGLLLGTLVALAASAVGVFLLVRQSLKPVEITISRLKQFCADAAHELRTPLTAVQTNAAVALRHPEGMREGDKQKLAAIVSGATQMERLTADLLLLARSEQAPDENVSAATESISVSPVVAKVMQDVRAEAVSKQLHLVNKVPDGLEIQVDRKDLSCILGNLVGNAVKYTPDGGEVTVSAIKNNGFTTLCVFDTGIGISKKDLDRIFDRFWRADKARSHQSGGNGLGLSIAKAITEKYAGEISVSSEPGKGSTFTVRLANADHRSHAN